MHTRKWKVEKDDFSMFLNTPEQSGHGWMEEIPYDVREYAITDFVKAVTIQKQMVADGKRRFFTMSYRTRNDPQCSFTVRSRCVHSDPESKRLFTFTDLIYTKEINRWIEKQNSTLKKGGKKENIIKYSTKTKDPRIKMKVREDIPAIILYDVRIIKTRTDKYYIAIPDCHNTSTSTTCNKTQVPSQKVCALDPGSRKFQTIYDPCGKVLEVGLAADAESKIAKICRSSDSLRSKIDTCSDRRRRCRLTKAMLRTNQRIRDRIADLHRKLAKFLTLNYNVVFLPVFETSKMVAGKHDRVISGKTARSMLTWSHYQFKQRLLYKASQTSHCQVIICGEAYTSKTCGKCGKLHKVKGSEWFTCPQPNCGFSMDRDHNGARNILLRNASSFSFVKSK